MSKILQLEQGDYVQLEELTKNSRIKLTQARKEILKALVEAGRPLSYYDLKEHITMDKATFYRNVSIFEEEHIIFSFESHDKKRYFEIAKVPHGHFICNACNSVECLYAPMDLGLEGYGVESIVINGLCPLCNRGV